MGDTSTSARDTLMNEFGYLKPHDNGYRMPIQVHQMQNSWLIDERYAVSYSDAAESEKNQLARKMFLSKRYDFVAVVDTDSLETAYRLTQNINSSWSQEPDPRVRVMCPLPVYNGMIYGIKSTEIGDICILNGELFRCARTGWESCGMVQEQQ